MTMAALVCIEGVLSKDGPPNGKPIDEGMALLTALRTQYTVVLSTTCTETPWVEHWLAVVGIKELHWLYTLPEITEPYEARMEHMGDARLLGYDLALVVTGDPQVAAEAQRQSITSLLFLHPRYSRPEARPDFEQPMKAWADIEDEIEQRRIVREDYG